MSQQPKRGADWVAEEDERAGTQTTQVANDAAPQMVRVKRAPARKQKAFYIQDRYAQAFERLAFEQKQANGTKAPALAEEALDLLFAKYGIEV